MWKAKKSFIIMSLTSVGLSYILFYQDFNAQNLPVFIE